MGSLPLAFTLSPSQLRLISSIGMGVLVGTSLIVIIPEGVETLYSATTAPKLRKEISARSAVNWPHNDIPAVADPRSLHVPQVRDLSDTSLHASEGEYGLPPTVRVTRDSYERKEESSSSDRTEEAHEDEDRSPHAWIGIALISGFILMYLIDKLPEFAASSKHERTPYHISLDNLGSGLRRNSSPSREGGLLNAGSVPRSSHSFATTTGLVIHAAADGIALGASSSDTGLSFIIFLAIMVHKAPASFGLTSVLLKQGISSRAARAHLLVFSLAAPVGALVTFLFVHIMGGGTDGDETRTYWRTGILLLFSAGTFL